MEGRCAVETWTEFGFLGTSTTPKVRFGTDVFICTGNDEVYVFSTHERKLKAVLQLPGPVTDLVESHDKQLLYVACSAGVYCVNLQSVLHRALSSSPDSSSIPAELKISEFLVIEADGVSSLLLVGTVLLTLSQRDSSWLMTLYKTPEQTQSSSYEVLGSFSLPLVSAVVQADTESKTSVLICLHCGDTAPLTLPHGHFCLEPVLFKLLFGVEAALAKSPVILCGLPDGRLCFLPLRLPGARLRVLHSIEQPVVFVGASVVTETGPGHSQCLVAMGEQGRVVLIKTEKGRSEDGSSLAGFTEGIVSGPVQCGCLDRNCLYYSTGSDLLLLDLSEGSSGKESKERVEETSRKTLQSPTSLNVSRVVALAEPTSNTSGEVQLLGLSVRGQLQRISLPARRKDAGLSKLPSAQVGRSIRDLLSAIGDVCERASVLKTAIKSKNQILRHLNQVVNISFLLTATNNTEDDPAIKEKPIRCHAITSWSRLLQKDCLNLTCVLDNSSPFVLERGWTLSVTVFPLCCSSTAGEEISSANFSFPFQNLNSGETLEVSLPIAAAGDSSFPMTVNCSLIFSLSSLLGEQEAASSNISLPLNTLTVDWLNALQLNSPTARHKMVTFQPGSITTDPIQAFISSRQIRCSGRADRGAESGSRPEKYSASVRVSSELLKDSLVLKNSNLDPKVPKTGPENTCIALIEWLLSEGPGGVKMRHQGDEISLSSLTVHACGPNGATVKLTAKKMNVEEENTEKEERLTAVEVQVESSSMTAVCGLHHAVLSRIQILLQKAPEKATSKKTMQILGLREALQRAEVQQNQISGALGVGMTAGQMNPGLLSVYQELRQNPLLII
ncbi:Fanconi anemia core complex-associated protein 100 [Acanthochromis polyacanthus]|uniref:Fanconi anemia core complex-associated protein 100 n=1 Tax=Acanthochromis polyacanthus TaxID=80966 RepID=UPI0022347A9B|nr:Fanconi anemia core complex-associated protein 100 [Acanthochromis polyacanthus]